MKKDSVDISPASEEGKKPAVKADKAVKTKAKKQNKVFKYFRELKAEFKKVVWPTKKQVVNNTGVVIVAMIFSGIILLGLDTGFKELFDLILRR